VRHSLVGWALLAALAFHSPLGAEPKPLRIGMAPGPYVDLVKRGVLPGLKALGYDASVVEFQDWVQPDLALAHGEIEANLFQHRPYLERFCADHGLKLAPLVGIPTAGLGLYSKALTSLGQLKPGSDVTLPQDPTNLARALRFLQAAGLLRLDPAADPLRATEKDVRDNPHGLRLVPTEAAQLPRTLNDAALAVVTGNYALVSGLKLSDALLLEKLTEDMVMVAAVRSQDLGQPFARDLKAVIQSAAFHAVASDPAGPFSQFQAPAWYAKKWGGRP
jgi:D-methionine transport system substrate-binding protein